MALTPSELELIVELNARLRRRRCADVRNQNYYLLAQKLEQLGMAIPPEMRRFMVIANWPRVVVRTIAGRQKVRALILPAIALAVVQAAILARFTRSAVLEVLREDFVRTARAKGLSHRATLWGHVLRNAMIPVITVMGLQFAELLAGTIVVENVFYLPGLGRLIFQSIANRDVIVVRNCVMLLATMVVIVNFIVDVLYAVIDPRVKASEI